MTPLKVAVGIIQNDVQQILLSGRTQHNYLTDYWELPGGKIKSAETPTEAIKRELLEELGIKVLELQDIGTNVYKYPDLTIKLSAFKILKYSGNVNNQESQKLKWHSENDLFNAHILKSSLPIIRKLLLAEKYFITPEKLSTQQLIKTINQVCQQHNVLIQYRDPKLNKLDFEHQAAIAIDTAHKNNCRILLNTDPETAIKLGADGVHLNSKRLNSCVSKPTKLLVAASTHNKQEVIFANQLNLDLIVISPIKNSTSHPAKPIGWQKFNTLSKFADMPTYALAGIKIKDLTKSKENNGYGISGIDCFIK